MSAAETVKAFSSAVEFKDFDKAASYLSDDFVYTGSLPQALDKGQFIALLAALQHAMPNLSYNLHGVEEQGNKVRATIHLTGKHSVEFVLPVPMMQPVPATEREISLPEQPIELSFNGDQIASLTIFDVPGAGIAGFLEQMGVQPVQPSMTRGA